MKKKELQEIKVKSIADLSKLADGKRVEIDKALLEIGVQKEKNLKKAKNAKKELAQLLTLMTEKDLSVKEETK